MVCQYSPSLFLRTRFKQQFFNFKILTILVCDFQYRAAVYIFESQVGLLIDQELDGIDIIAKHGEEQQSQTV